MELGFETIGNATVIAYDRKPVLVTDPWIVGTAYFGSWGLPHEIPLAQMAAIKQCDYVWLSHGHPDHTHGQSLALLRDKVILLPDHHNGRMLRGLRADGFTVQLLPDRQWQPLSQNVRVLCIADYNQDAILLIDLGGVLFVNLNDAWERGWGPFVKKTVARYRLSFLAALTPTGGGADMMNFFTEEGQQIFPESVARLEPGFDLAMRAERYGARYYIPFSSMHRYQRSDSVWGNDYTVKLADLPRGFRSRTAELLPAYIQYDCKTGQVHELAPAEAALQIAEPEEYGDNWSEVLDHADQKKIRAYFHAIQHLKHVFSHITIRVGGQDAVIDLGGPAKRKALRFEVPRQSLMNAIESQVFDDLLIANFMKTTCLGYWGREEKSLYPDFSPYVAKYADNGGARTSQELRAYFQAYRQRDSCGFIKHRLEKSTERFVEHTLAARFRAHVSRDSYWYGMAKRAQRLLLGAH